MVDDYGTPRKVLGEVEQPSDRRMMQMALFERTNSLNNNPKKSSMMA